MKLKDFLKEAFDVDISSGLTSDWIIAFVGPVELTTDGITKFASILDNEVCILDCSEAKIEIADENQDELAKELFYSLAGYCSCSYYDKFFLCI